MDSHNNWHNAI